MLNTAVSLGRCGIPVTFYGTSGADPQGEFIRSFLHKNGVGTSGLTSASHHQTPLALAWLNPEKEAQYQFYKQKEFPLPSLPKLLNGDFLLYGSFFSLQENIHNAIHLLLSKHSSDDIFVIYDPNFRKPHKADLPLLRSAIEKNISTSNLVRSSDEDFQHIFDCNDGATAWQICYELGASALVYTRGEKGATFYGKGIQAHQASLAKSVVSTVGAGDAFNAGMLAYLCSNEWKPIASWEKPFAEGLLLWGSRFAAKVCASPWNYVERNCLDDLTDNEL
jgi:fructokinase